MTPSRLYDRLLSASVHGDPFDRHVFASVLSVACTEAGQSLSVAVGLERPLLCGLLSSYFPSARHLIHTLPPRATAGPRLPEEEAVKDLLMRHGTSGCVEEVWLAAIIARRAQRPGHLWQSLGLRGRDDLTHVMHSHFRPLAERNIHHMKWKKFLYRQACEAEGVSPCPARGCEDCSDRLACFAGDDVYH